MMNNYQKIKRHRKLEILSNTVLLDNDACEPGRAHLEEKIIERVNKEFPNPTDEETEILEGIINHNLCFVPRKMKRHKNTEFFVQVESNVREKDVHLFYKFQNPVEKTGPHIDGDSMGLFITLDSLVRAGVRSITLYAPFLPYMRQDKKDDGRVPITAKLYFNLLEASSKNRLKRIQTYDLHAQQEQGFFDGPLDELPATPEFTAYYKDLFLREPGYSNKNTLGMAVDSGGVKKAIKGAELLGTSWDVFEKIRTAHSEANTRLNSVNRKVEGKKIVIFEDMVDSAGSIAGEEEKNKDGPIQYLIKLGAEVYCCATHGIFSEKNGITAEQRLRNSGAKILITDSIPERYPGYFNDNKDWLTVVSLDYVTAKAFYCNQVGESISEFLCNRETRLKADKLDFKVSNEKGTYTVE
jgi:ribose-phosphate pyrophosphokinase